MIEITTYYDAYVCRRRSFLLPNGKVFTVPREYYRPELEVILNHINLEYGYNYDVYDVYDDTMVANQNMKLLSEIEAFELKRKFA